MHLCASVPTGREKDRHLPSASPRSARTGNQETQRQITFGTEFFVILIGFQSIIMKMNLTGINLSHKGKILNFFLSLFLDFSNLKPFSVVNSRIKIQ